MKVWIPDSQYHGFATARDGITRCANFANGVGKIRGFSNCATACFPSDLKGSELRLDMTNLKYYTFEQ